MAQLSAYRAAVKLRPVSSVNQAYIGALKSSLTETWGVPDGNGSGKVESWRHSLEGDAKSFSSVKPAQLNTGRI